MSLGGCVDSESHNDGGDSRRRRCRRLKYLAAGVVIGTGIVISLPFVTLWFYGDRIIYGDRLRNGTFSTRKKWRCWLDEQDRITSSATQDSMIGLPYCEEDLWISTSDNDGVLRGWLMKHKEITPSRPTIIYFSDANGEEAISDLPWELFSRAGCNVVTVPYRFGAHDDGSCEGSAGNLDRTLDDAESILFNIRQRQDVDPSIIYLSGTALGGAVAIELAARHPNIIKGCLLENVFISERSRIAHTINVARWWPWLLDRMTENSAFGELDSLDAIEYVTPPTMFISTSMNNDNKNEPIPATKEGAGAGKASSEHMIQLLAQSGANCKWFVTSDVRGKFGEHNINYGEALKQFITETQKPRPRLRRVIKIVS